MEADVGGTSISHQNSFRYTVHSLIGKVILILGLSVNLLFSLPSSAQTDHVSTADGTTLQKPCEDCCEIGLLVSTVKDFDLINVPLPEDYTSTDEKTRSVLKGTYHSGITVNGSIYDFGLGLGSWRIIQKKLRTRTVSQLINTPIFQERLEKEDYYHLVLTVPSEACNAMKNFWEQMGKTRPRYNVKTSNCHILCVQGLIESLPNDTKVNEYFAKDDNGSNRWGVVDFRKVHEHMRSNCGQEIGKPPRLEVFKTSKHSLSLGDTQGDLDGCKECNPSVYDNQCNPILRLDLGSGTDLTIDVEITRGSEISPISFSEKYETTYTELRELNSGRFQSGVQTFTTLREDGSGMINKFVGGVDLTNLAQAASLGKILPKNSYDLITCAHPDPTAGALPNVQQVFEFLKEGGEFRIAFYDFDYYSDAASAMVKEIEALFSEVQKIQVTGNRYALRKPPMVSLNDYIISGVKRASIERQSAVSLSRKVKIYPNPASDRLHIEGLEQDADIEIYNMLGVKVKTVSTSSVIDISDIDIGLYVVRMHPHLDSTSQQITLYVKLLEIKR